MDAEDFRKYIIDKSDDYGLCSPPTEAQEGLSILMKHFLGDDWYVTMSVSTEQVNTDAIYEILKRFPNKKPIVIRIIEKFQRMFK